MGTGWTRHLRATGYACLTTLAVVLANESLLREDVVPRFVYVLTAFLVALLFWEAVLALADRWRDRRRSAGGRDRPDREH